MRINMTLAISVLLLLVGWMAPVAAASAGGDGSLDLRTVVTFLSTLLTLFIGFYARSLENKVEAKMDKALADAILSQFDSSYKAFAASVREGNDRMSTALSQMQQLELKMVRDTLSRQSVRDIVSAELQPLRLELAKITQRLPSPITKE